MQQAETPPAKPGALASVLGILNASVGRKLVTGLTGLGLIAFLVIHLLGNLTIFGGAHMFNAYAHELESLGPYLYVMEFGLLGLFIFHIFFAIAVTFQNKGARKSRYVNSQNAGKPSRKSLSSQTMIYTGIVLLVFLVAHVIMFKFGKYYTFMEHGSAVTSQGHELRDLYRLVHESFKNIWITSGYVGVMILLGVHVRHGFWSAFQSLGAYHPRYTPLLYTLGLLVALVFAVGFLVLPIYLYFVPLAA